MKLTASPATAIEDTLDINVTLIMMTAAPLPVFMVSDLRYMSVAVSVWVENI